MANDTWAADILTALNKFVCTPGGNVTVTNFPSVQALTNAELRATPVPVSGNFSLSGSVAVSNFPVSQPVTGTFWQATQPVSVAALPLPSGASTEATLALIKAKTDNLDVLLSTRTKPADTQVISGSVSVSNFPASQAVTGTFWPVTQPVSGPLTDAQLRASAVPISVASLPLPSGASTAALQTQPGVDIGDVTINNASGASAVNVQDGGNIISVDDGAGSLTVDGTVTANAGSGVFDVTPASPVANDYLPVRITDGSSFKDPTQIRALTTSDNVTVTQAALTKGAQGSTGVSTQDLKDAGRSYLSFTANAVAGVTSEALLSFVQNKQGTNTSNVTSYTVTSGKTLRITSISFSVKSAAAAIAFSKIILRHNTAGATTASSNIAYLSPEINTNSATSGTSAWITIPIPDGIEFFGNGTQTIGVSHLDQATTNVLCVTVCGFEY